VMPPRNTKRYCQPCRPPQPSVISRPAASGPPRTWRPPRQAQPPRARARRAPRPCSAPAWRCRAGTLVFQTWFV